VLTPNQAIRVNGLYSRNAYGPPGATTRFSDDKSIDVAYAIKLTPSTSFRSEVEFGRLKRMTFATNYGDNVGYYNGSYQFDGTNALPTLANAPAALNQTSAGSRPSAATRSTTPSFLRGEPRPDQHGRQRAVALERPRLRAASASPRRSAGHPDGL